MASLEIVSCPTCGGPVSALVEEFRHLGSTGEALDKLMVDRLCCRSHIMGALSTLELSDAFMQKNK